MAFTLVTSSLSRECADTILRPWLLRFYSPIVVIFQTPWALRQVVLGFPWASVENLDRDMHVDRACFHPSQPFLRHSLSTLPYPFMFLLSIFPYELSRSLELGQTLTCWLVGLCWRLGAFNVFDK